MDSIDRSQLPTIGLLVRRVDVNDYDKELWKSTYDLARNQGCNLLLVAGHLSFSPDPFDSAYQAVYRMLNPKLADGYILSQTVALWMSPEEIAAFSKELPPSPFVTTSIKYGDLPCVYVDNATGLRALMRHLIEVHGCRRIVHVRGPSQNREAQLRENVWREELLLAGIVPDDHLLVQGHFRKEDLANIGSKVIESTQGDFDAVVACNDTAALRVIEDFQSMGFQVPEDYLVCGFDDSLECQFSTPSLTTVRQPVELLARKAWDSLHRMLSAGDVPRDDVVDTSLVVRSSCSCSDLGSSSGEQDLNAQAILNHNEVVSFQEKVRKLNGLSVNMNRVTTIQQMGEVLLEWLPKLGIHTFAVLRTCTLAGVPADFLCRRTVGEFLPAIPDAFQVLAIWPDIALDENLVIPASGLSLRPWFAAIEPFVLGTFPLVVGEVWYGLAFLELSQEAGIVERAVQEQISSVFHRLAIETTLNDRNLEERTKARVKTEQMEALDRLVSEVAHEINTPLGAIVSSNLSMQAAISDLIQKSPAFFSSLSPEGMNLLQRLSGQRSGKSPGLHQVQERKTRRVLTQALIDIPLIDPEKTAEELASMGWNGSIKELQTIAILPEFASAVDYLCRVDEMITSSQIISTASEKVSEFISRLRKSSRA